jgi:hypothetical protein
VPDLVRYFTPEKKVQTKVTEFNNVKGETADVLTTHLMNVLHKYKLSDKIIAFCGDNCNTNFGGGARRGTKNVVARLKTNNLKMKIQGAGCAAHILHRQVPTFYQLMSRPQGIKCTRIFRYIRYGWRNCRNSVTSLMLNINRFLEV